MDSVSRQVGALSSEGFLLIVAILSVIYIAGRAKEWKRDPQPPTAGQ